MKSITIKLNVPLKGKKAGAEFPIMVDKAGTPLDLFWRKRVKDSKIDNCLEIVKKTKEKKGGKE